MCGVPVYPGDSTFSCEQIWGIYSIEEDPCFNDSVITFFFKKTWVTDESFNQFFWIGRIGKQSNLLVPVCQLLSEMFDPEQSSNKNKITG